MLAPQSDFGPSKTIVALRNHPGGLLKVVLTPKNDADS